MTVFIQKQMCFICFIFICVFLQRSVTVERRNQENWMEKTSCQSQTMEMGCERVSCQCQIVWRAVISSQRSCSITSPCRPQLGAWEKEDWGLNPGGFEADRIAGENKGSKTMADKQKERVTGRNSVRIEVPGEPRIIWACLSLCFWFLICFVSGIKGKC